MIPNVVSIAGVDPSGGAGVFADIKAFSALGAYGCGVVTALTAQNTRSVDGVLLVDTDFVARQIRSLFADVRIDAIKIGMLGAVPLITAVSDALAATETVAPVILDPVMVAKSGDTLLADDAIGALREQLLPMATMITPNLPEAGVLLDQTAPASLPEMRRALERLRRLLPDTGQRWVLLKGGHLPDAAHDLLFDGDRLIELPAERIQTKNTHGTGCTLSAAIAALLPQSDDPVAAVRHAKDYLLEAIRRSGELNVGGGHGPVHHFHALWSKPE